ncbi:MAG: nucleotidyl transferase AbiEii/AbiGii toxin family protein [Streptosporangiaceae bacterium]
MTTLGSARAHHQSLRAHARNAAAQDPAYSAQERLRFFAFSRFLARVFADQPDDWALKGAGALLARIPVARASNDLDLVARSSLDLVEDRLRQAAAVDLEDGFTFAIMSGSRPITGNNRGLRFTAETRIGPYRLATFRVDVVIDWTNTRPIETVPPAAPIPTAASPGPPWRVYPIADHLADKVCATYEHADPVRSTRFHDLVDIALIACNLAVRAADLVTALESESRRRGIALPGGYLPPDQAMWERGFTKLRRAAGPFGARWPSYPEAVTIAQALLDPVLATERLDGTWDPAKRQWTDEQSRPGAR